MKTPIALLTLIIVSNLVFSFNSQDVIFHKFPLKENLPGSSVKRVFQDHKGFICGFHQS